MAQPKIALIGGGTGSYTLLRELKYWTPNITAIVNMSDDGGSSGELRDELGVLPPGDVRQCLVALSNHEATRELFSYRFSEGGKLGGHPVGNIILSALELKYSSFTKAIEIVAEFLQITGEVVPVTTNKSALVLTDGKKIIKGEHKITKHKIINRDAKLNLQPSANMNPKAHNAILQADIVVIAPGNLYGSLLPAMIVKGMSKALNETKAKVVMVANLINKPEQTYGWHVADYIQEIERYIGDGRIDLVLYNNKLPSKKLLSHYAQANELPVQINPEKFKTITTQALGASLISQNRYKQDPNDKAIVRTLIRHDAKKVAKILSSLSI